MAGLTVDPLEPCELHDMQNCAICRPPKSTYRQGLRLPVPESCYVSVRGGKGVYHHPDCYNVTGDWDGERLVHTAAELASGNLRPAECCRPPAV